MLIDYRFRQAARHQFISRDFRTGRRQNKHLGIIHRLLFAQRYHDEWSKTTKQKVIMKLITTIVAIFIIILAFQIC